MKKRNIYESTIGRSKYPCFLENNNKRKMLPRPVTKSSPGTLGYQFLNTCNWLQDLVKEKLCLKHLFNMKTSRSKNILRQICFSKKHVPPCLRI